MYTTNLGIGKMPALVKAAVQQGIARATSAGGLRAASGQQAQVEAVRNSPLFPENQSDSKAKTSNLNPNDINSAMNSYAKKSQRFVSDKVGSDYAPSTSTSTTKPLMANSSPTFVLSERVLLSLPRANYPPPPSVEARSPFISLQEQVAFKLYTKISPVKSPPRKVDANLAPAPQSQFRPAVAKKPSAFSRGLFVQQQAEKLNASNVSGLSGRARSASLTETATFSPQTVASGSARSKSSTLPRTDLQANMEKASLTTADTVFLPTNEAAAPADSSKKSGIRAAVHQFFSSVFSRYQTKEAEKPPVMQTKLTKDMILLATTQSEIDLNLKGVGFGVLASVDRNADVARARNSQRLGSVSFALSSYSGASPSIKDEDKT